MIQQSRYVNHIVPQPDSTKSFIELLAEKDDDERQQILNELREELGEERFIQLKYEWKLWGRPNQFAPEPRSDWRTWCILAGRGWGKTRVGAETVRDAVESGRAKRIALIAPTAADISHVMLNGESGLLNICPPWNKPEWSPTNRIIRWKNGAIAETYSAEEPERLRGPQHDFAWCDEIAAWRYPETWDMLQFGLRLGRNPQVVVTTTPKPVPVLKEILMLPGTWTTLGTTYENVSNLSTSFFTDIIKKYEGTRLGEQELMAHIIEDVPGALWNRDNLDKYRIKYDEVDRLPDFLQIVVAVDPATTARTSSAQTGLCVAAYGSDDHFYVLHLDAVKESPNEWAERVLDLYDQYRADKIIAEVNNGGDLVNAVITNVRPFAKVDAVYASRGKVTRAEPVSTMYERGRVHHVGFFPSGEEQMVQFNPVENPYGLKDMVDALVWALTKLIEDTQGVDYYKPRVGGIRDKLVNYRYR